MPLAAYSPELNPVERVWLYLRERFLWPRFRRDNKAIISCCRAMLSPPTPIASAPFAPSLNHKGRVIGALV